MAYCTNCGNEIMENSKFCPNCGTKIPQKIERKPPLKRRMQKGVVKSLEEETSNFIKSKTGETAFPKMPKEKLFSKEVPQTNDTQPEDTGVINNRKKSKNLILFYVLLNVVLFSFGQGSDEVIGLEFFSAVILIIYFIRHKKEKPFNWLLKLLLVLQLVLVFSIFMTQYEYLFLDSFSLLTSLPLLGLFIAIILLLFRGNKNY